MEKKQRKLTERQKKFLANKTAGMSSHKAALEAGYSPATAKNANQNIVEKQGVQDIWLKTLAKHGVDEDKLAFKIAEGLDAHKLSTSLTEPDKVVPDFSTRHKYVETALEQIGKKVKDTVPIQVAFINNVRTQKEDYDL